MLTGPLYRIQQGKLALSVSQEDHKSLIVEKVDAEPVDRQTWTIEFRGDGSYIKSEENGLYIGFDEHAPFGKEKLIVGQRDIAKVWEIYEVRPGEATRIRLLNKPFIIITNWERTRVELGMDVRVIFPNLVWVFTEVN